MQSVEVSQVSSVGFDHKGNTLSPHPQDGSELAASSVLWFLSQHLQSAGSKENGLLHHGVSCLVPEPPLEKPAYLTGQPAAVRTSAELHQK